MGKDVLGSGHLHRFGTNELKLFIFVIGGAPYAINLAKLRETVRLRPDDVVSLSVRPSEYVAGQLLLRDEVISLIDLPGYFQEAPQALPDDEGVAIIAEYDGQKVAIIVDDIHFNTNVAWTDVLAPGACAQLGAPITGFYLHDDLGIVQILDFEHIRNEVIGSPYGELQPTAVDLNPQPVALVAEDSKSVRDSVCRLLRESGMQVLSCSTGEEAWQMYQRRPDDIHLLITDIEMPQMDGTALVTHVRNHKGGDALPIILLSSMTNEMNVSHYMKLGIDVFLGKHHMHQLMDFVVQLLDEGRPKEAVQSQAA